ncbi:HCL684Cp [Eremothecium sinecaudum]|uniref:L-serine ammonia-lyase n=1 Tax=Eremothecium sinecaudum TaxID=45286 RepID=A0A109UY57_9SACH|nr:HCL684Cp [Eremothecium sinecaudum]AMD19467.1 HCL684Cp [Eremothecium sinecaudum]
MTNYYVKTPLMHRHFPNLGDSNYASPTFMVKYEGFQPGGSFKSRGIGNLIYSKMKTIQESTNKTAEVFASSGGNAGLAAATTSHQLGLKCTVVVPKTTKPAMIARIKCVNATVLIRGEDIYEADQYLKKELLGRLDYSKIDPIYVHPFNNPLIWKGHSFLVDEIVDCLRDDGIKWSNIKGIVCSVGGGGLFNGIVQGLERHNLADKVPIIGVETRGCEVFFESIRQGKRLEFTRPHSVATSLCTSTITEETLAYAKRYSSKSLVLEEHDVIDTCLRFTNDSNMVTEPACGAALHVGYYPELLHRALGPLNKDDIIIIIACGGFSTSVADLKELKVKYEQQNQQQSRAKATSSDIPSSCMNSLNEMPLARIISL